MAVPQAKKKCTPAEYYALERDAAYKSDYYKGEIYDMSGGTGEHSQITSNIIVATASRLRGGRCLVRESNQRLKIQATGLRTYPDVSIYCEPVQYDTEDSERQTALNPTVVFEVLSSSTEAYDRGLKAQSYRQVESLKAYVLIAQDRAYVEVYVRQTGGWSIRDASGLDAIAPLAAIAIELPLSEIYDRVEFPPHVSPRGGNI
jgi:Uma2 family endonuclease